MSELKATVTEQLQQLQMLMHRASFHSFTGCAKAHNPHRGQGRVLAILKMKPEISQRELTYLLNMSKQSLAELLAKLEKSGYITREPSQEDKRVMAVKLTEKGMEADVEDASPETANSFDCLNEEELAALSGYLERIIKEYEKQFPEEDFEQRRQSMEQFMAHHGRGCCGERRGRGHGHGGNDFGGFGGKYRHHGNWR